MREYRVRMLGEVFFQQLPGLLLIAIFLQYEQIGMIPSSRFTRDNAALSSVFCRSISSLYRFASVCKSVVTLPP